MGHWGLGRRAWAGCIHWRGWSLLLGFCGRAAIRRARSSSAAEVGDTGFLGHQRVNEVTLRLVLLRERENVQNIISTANLRNFMSARIIIIIIIIKDHLAINVSVTPCVIMGFFQTCGDVGSFGELLDESESAGRPSFLKNRHQCFHLKQFRMLSSL